MTAPGDALVFEATDAIILAEDLITLQVVHDKLDGSPPAMAALADAHPGPAACPVKPVPRRPRRVG